MSSIRISFYWALPGALLLLLIHSPPFVLFLLNHPSALGKESVLYFFQHFRDLCFVLLLFSGFYSLGNLILRSLKSAETHLNCMEKFLYSSLLGEAAAGYLLLVLGLMGLFQTKNLAALFLLLVVLSLRMGKEILPLFSSFKNLLTKKYSIGSFLLVLIFFMAMLRGFIASGSPPVNWDSLAYHLAFPKLFLEEEKIFRIPWST